MMVRTFVILSERKKIELRGSLADAKRAAVAKCNAAGSITIMDRDDRSVVAKWRNKQWA